MPTATHGTDQESALPVPVREQLLQQLQRSNRWGVVIVLLQLVGIVVLWMTIDWQLALANPVVTGVAACWVVGSFLIQVLTFAAQNKREISDLREETRFGVFDKHLLSSLFRDTLKRLNIADERLPVYIVAEKQVNAAALHIGMGRAFRRLNGIYLNRQMLHKLTPEELQDTIGHELGHYYRYYLIADRFRIITFLLGGLLGIGVTQWVGTSNSFGTFALMAINSAFWGLSKLPYLRNAMAIEYLCDDLGAHVHGIGTSISSLMKLGAEEELTWAIHQQAVVSKHRGGLSTRDVLEAVTKAIPYGHASKEELEVAVEKAIRSKAQERPSLAGFLGYMWNSERDAELDDEFEAEMKKLKLLEAIPRLDWESLLKNPSEIEFEGFRLAQLISLIESEPTSELFRAPSLLVSDGVHPPLKLRILYLWRNRAEIQATRAPSALFD